MDQIAAAHEAGPIERGTRAATALRETWESLAEVCHGLVTQEWALATECPGWTVQDQLSHLIGIERLLLGDAAPTLSGPLGEHVKNDFAIMNEPWVAVRRFFDGDVVLAEFVEITGLRMAALAEVTGSEWAAVGISPLGQMSLAEFIELRVYDSWVHEQDVRLALDRPGGWGVAASGISLARVQSAMPKVVGKQAGCPDGTVVRFEIVGSQGDARQFSVAVSGGRAAFAANDLMPTVTLTMSSHEFVRLGCGRATSEQLREVGTIGVDGDLVLGDSILDAMNFMF